MTNVIICDACGATYNEKVYSCRKKFGWTWDICQKCFDKLGIKDNLKAPLKRNNNDDND